MTLPDRPAVQNNHTLTCGPRLRAAPAWFAPKRGPSSLSWARWGACGTGRSLLEEMRFCLRFAMSTVYSWLMKMGVVSPFLKATSSASLSRSP